MENNQISKSTVGFGLSFAISSIFSGLLVIFKETNEGLKDWMASLTGHHWVTHGIFTIALFFILGYIFSKMDIQAKFDAQKLKNIVIWSTVVGSALVVGFILIHIS